MLRAVRRQRRSLERARRGLGRAIRICAIGLAVKQMVSLHGIALNVRRDLDYDRLINPCGLTDRGITSLSAQTGRP